MHALQLEVSASDCERVERLLIEAGAVSVSVGAADDEEVFVEHGAESTLWQRCCVQALFSEPIDAQALQDELGVAVGVEDLPEQDWQRASSAHEVDKVFAERLHLLAPGKSVREGCVPLYLRPGLAFGSGSHVTTSMCLERIAGRDWSGCSMLDFGCGSGVLSLAAARLGASYVQGVDIDPQALLATTQNGQYNAVDKRVLEVVHVDRFVAAERSFDFVVANILANPLVQLAATLTESIHADGEIWLTGVLQEQVAQIEHAYPEVALKVDEVCDGWALLKGRRIGGS